jgi:signal transduction histidine kinase
MRVIAALCVVVPCLCSTNCERPADRRAAQGGLDLSGANLARAASLDGDWRFYWRSFVNPASAAETEAPVTFQQVPGFWNNAAGLSPEGFASYQLDVKLPAGKRLYGLRIVDMESAYRLFANGEEIASNGVPGTSRETETPEWKPQVGLFEASGHVRLTLHISNFHHRLGGIWQGMKLGTADSILTSQRKSLALDLAVTGSLIIIAVYHSLIFFVRRAERGFILLAVFCLIMALRTLVISERFIVTLFPGLWWDLLVRLDYLTVSLGLISAHAYLKVVFARYYDRRVFSGVLAVFGLCAAAEILLPVRWFTHLLPVHNLFLLLFSLYFLVIAFQAVRARMPGAAAMWTGWLIAISANVNDSLYIMSAIDSAYISAIGLQAFILTQSYYLARRYSDAFALSAELARRMQSLLGLTREFNRARDRETAVRRALAELSDILEQPGLQAFIPVRDSPAMRRIAADRPGEPADLAWSSKADALTAPAEQDGRLLIPLRGAGELLCVIDLPSPDPARLQYVHGVLDSLSLVLDNMRRVESATLVSIGQAAAEIVHDINHHCQVIQAHTAAKNSRDQLHVIENETRLMTNLALDILDFARENVIVSPVSVAVEKVRDVFEQDIQAVFANTNMRHSISLSSSGQIRLDLERFRRVCANLARNASAACGQSGSFRIEIETREDAVAFVFEDDGPGIDPSIQERLFEPFASGGRGTGLGLAVVKRIVSAHGGTIQVHSAPGQGCRFVVLLPANFV